MSTFSSGDSFHEFYVSGLILAKTPHFSIILRTFLIVKWGFWQVSQTKLHMTISKYVLFFYEKDLGYVGVALFTFVSYFLILKWRRLPHLELPLMNCSWKKNPVWWKNVWKEYANEMLNLRIFHLINFRKKTGMLFPAESVVSMLVWLSFRSVLIAIH